jgi:hypothetical protein
MVFPTCSSSFLLDRDIEERQLNHSWHLLLCRLSSTGKPSDHEPRIVHCGVKDAPCSGAGKTSVLGAEASVQPGSV